MEIETTEETLQRYIELNQYIIKNPFPQTPEKIQYQEIKYLLNEAIKLTEELKLQEK